jgi:hemin uptake protein HemP
MSDPDPPEEKPMDPIQTSPTAGAQRAPVDTIDAHVLLGRAGMLRIELDGELYTLRVTRNNRLILTK